MTEFADNARDVIRLVRDARRGSDDALAELYGRYSAMVFKVAFSLTESAADATDVMQDVFIGLPEAAGDFEQSEEFERWLRRVTTLLTMSLVRQRVRRSEWPLSALMDDRLAITKDPPEFVRELALERAIAGLPPEWRAVFVLREVNGFSHEEIGEILGISANVSSTRLYRAIRRLRDVLSRRP